jgi:hypothetical protein
MFGHTVLQAEKATKKYLFLLGEHEPYRSAPAPRKAHSTKR